MSQSVAHPAERLAEILAKENAALKRADYVAAVALLPDKEAALAALTKLGPKGVAPELGRRVRGLAAENQALLEQAARIQGRLVRLIVQASQKVRRLETYGQKIGQQRPAVMNLSA